MIYIVSNTITDSPYAMIIEICIAHHDEPIKLQIWKMFVIHFPNTFNFASILIDVLLVKFLKKTIIPIDSRSLFDKSLYDQINQVSS